MASRKGDCAISVAWRNDDLGYPIIVAEDPLEEIAAFARARGKPAAILCDANRHVRAYAQRVAARSGRGPVIAFSLGERRKRLTTVERVLEALAQAGVERGSTVFGVGGGIASDLFGFASAIYMRGVRYAHVATSLVGMVDAAVGGKTGVDLRDGKNLAGVFADPVAVFCATGMLDSLSGAGFREGIAEIVKAGIIEGGDLFESLEVLAAHPVKRWPWPAVVPGALEVKIMAVADDRLEAGRRETLNLGHTFAHAIERASRYSVGHGEAVALGLRAAGLLALQTKRFTRDEHLRVLTLLALVGLPLQTSLEPDAIFEAMRNDKKRRAGRLRFVLPRAIGDVEFGIECQDRSVKRVLERLTHPPENVRARR